MKLCLPTQLVLCMKLTVILLLAAGLQAASAKGYSQGKINLSFRDAPLEKVLQEVSRQSGYHLWGDPRLLDGVRHISIDVRGVSLKDALDLCLAGSGLAYKITEEGYLVIDRRREEVVTGPVVRLPEEIDFHGTILNDQGQPLEGASVFVKGTKYGVETDGEGRFMLKGVDQNAILIVSYIGYNREEVALEGRKTLGVRLRRSSSELDQTVIKGYYSTTERLNTGDVTTIQGEDIQKQPVTDPLLALEGRVPGLYIQQTSGVPGAYSTVRLMGKNSLFNGNDPLYIVDGVPFMSTSLTNSYFGDGAINGANSISQTPFNATGGGLSPFNGLDLSDIESIEVLKDADATAIYGSRGANGVILINTKRGKVGQNRVDVNVYSGAGTAPQRLKMMNTEEYLQMRHEALHNDGKVPKATDYDINGIWDTTRYTNWEKTFIGNPASFTNANLNISGGNVNTQFSLGGGYSDQGTVYPGSFFDKKISAHISLTHTSASNRFKIQLSSSYVDDNNVLPGVDFTKYLTLAPDAPSLYNPDGTLNWQLHNGGATWLNPAAYGLISARSLANTFVNSCNFDYRIITGLHVISNLGYTSSLMNQQQVTPEGFTAPPVPDPTTARSLNLASTNSSTWLGEVQANYKKKISDGQLDLLFGTTIQQNTTSTSVQEDKGFSNDALITNPSAASDVVLAYDYALYRYNAIYGRAGYNLKNKYLINITARRDGSSRFGAGRQFGDFGAIGGGWIFSNEKLFTQNILPTLSFGKIKASYGTTGNDQIANYQYLSSYTATSYTYQGLSGLFPTQLANSTYGWETVKKLEGGVELGFFKDMVFLTVDYFRNRDGNQLVSYPLPSLSGFTSVQANLPAVVENKGWEFLFNVSKVSFGDVYWESSMNLTIPQNKLLAFPNISNSSYAHILSVGQSIFSLFKYDYLGVNAQTGRYSFVTKNSNGLPSNPADLYLTRPITQRYFGGFRNEFSYKGFQLDILFQFVGQRGYSAYKNLSMPGLVNYNEPTTVLSRWTTSGSSADVQLVSAGNVSAVKNLYSDYQNSNGVVTNASFVRLKNLAFSYQLPKNWSQTVHFQGARVYIQCQNLLTFTKYIGLDPETQGLTLPPLRMITGGMQITF